jgi:TRF2-interacting telomeric protein/Rap1 - C terminal domain
VIGGDTYQKSLRREALGRKRITDEGPGTHEMLPPKFQNPPSDMYKGTEVRDVFHAPTPSASHGKHGPFVLSTANLPEPSTASSVSRAQPDSSVPRKKAPHDKARRQTFGGFKSHSSVPDINLVEKLGKRPSHRLLGTRRVSLDTTDSGSVASTSRTRLTAPEQRAVLYQPQRTSIIPILVDIESQHTTPDLLNAWSPSTRNLVIQAGLASIFKRMEENHGFSTDVVRRAWLQQNMDLDATDRMLLRMRIAAEKAVHDEFYEGEGDVKQFGLSSRGALDRAQNVLKALSPADVTPEPDTDYTPPARSRAERYKLLRQGLVPEELPRKLNLVSRKLPSSTGRGDIVSQAVWTAEEDEILRSGDEDKLQILVNNFSEETVRRRFVAIMRETAS